MNFALQRVRRPDGVCVAVTGEVDAYTAPKLRAELLAAVREHPVVTVDLSAVTFMDSQGLTALITARQQAEQRGTSLVLDGVPPRVLKLLQLTGLDAMFAVGSPEHRDRAGASGGGGDAAAG